MATKLEQLKEWAKQNITLIDLLPNNSNLQVTTRLIDVLEDKVDEKYYLSEEKTKKLTLDTDLSVKLNHFNYDEMDRIYSIEKLSPTLNIMQGGNKQPKVAVPVLTPDRVNKRQNGRRFKENGEPMFTLTSQDRHGIAIREATKQGYALAKQGDSVNVSYPTSKTRRGRVGKQVAQTLQAGEVNQGVVILKEEYGRFGKQAIETLNDNKDVINDGMTVNAYNKTLDDSGLSPTLTTRHEGFKTAILPITNGLRIRKLTPLECWRLQGFTDEQFYKAKDSGVSNSQLYKQAGNAVTVNVVDYIVKNLYYKMEVNQWK